MKIYEAKLYHDLKISKSVPLNAQKIKVINLSMNLYPDLDKGNIFFFDLVFYIYCN